MKINDFEASIKAAKKGLKIKNTADFYNILGIAYKEKGEFKEAKLAYQEAIKLKKNNPIYLGNLGDLFDIQKEYPKAIEMLRKAITINSKLSSYWGSLGRALYHNGQLNEAISSIEKGLSLPRLQDLDILIGDNKEYMYETLGLIWKKKGDFESSIQMFQKAINISPESDEFRQELREVLSLKKEEDDKLNLKNMSEAAEKLKKLKQVSDKVNLDMLQDILKLDPSTFNENIIKWGEEFNFRIDGDYIKFGKDSEKQ